MKCSVKISLVLLCVLALNTTLSIAQKKMTELGQPVQTTLQNRTKSDSTQEEILKRLEKLSDKEDVNVDHVIATTSNYLTYGTIILGIVGLIGGIAVFKAAHEMRAAARNMRETERDMRNVERDTLDKSHALNNLYVSVNKVFTEIQLKYDDTNKLEEKLKSSNAKVEDLRIAMEEEKKKFEANCKVVLKVTPLFNEAVDKFNAGYIDAARLKFERIIEIDPDNIDAKANLAKCTSAIGNNSLALAEISALLHLPEVTFDTFSIYGVILRRQKLYDLSIEAFQSSLELSDYFSTYNHLGYSYLYKGDYENATRNFRLSLEKYGNNSAASYGLLKVGFLDGSVKTDPAILKIAMDNSSKGTKENPRFPYYHFGLAFSQMCLEDAGCLDSLKTAFEYTSNIGILKEQLFDYKLFKSNGINLKYLQPCMELIDKTMKKIVEERKYDPEILN